MSRDFTSTDKTVHVDLSCHSYLALKVAQEINRGSLDYVFSKFTRTECTSWRKHIDLTIEKLEEVIKLKMNSSMSNRYDSSEKVSYFYVEKMQMHNLGFWEEFWNKITNKKMTVKFFYKELTPNDKKEEKESEKSSYTSNTHQYKSSMNQEEKIEKAIKISHRNDNKKNRVHNPFGHDVEKLKLSRSFVLIDGEKR